MRSNKHPSVRIIAGSRKGSKIQFPETPGLRPSGDRIRETLFAWLQLSIENSHCLDMFAGSGALGFEAASRGAARAVMIEKSRTAVDALNDNAARLGFECVEVVAADALTDGLYSGQLAQQFDLVFIDPPFAEQLHANAVECVTRNNILRPEARVYIESRKRDGKLQVPEGWELHREKIAGEVRMQLYHVIAGS